MLAVVQAERVRTFAFIAVVAIVLTFASVAVWEKSVQCGNLGGEFKIWGGFRTMRFECLLPDCTVRPM
jgi:hypothetical protein